MATRYNYTGNIVTQGLVLNLDAAKTDSYPGTGTTWRDLSGFNNNGTLTNGPTFSGFGKEGAIVFDGVDDYVDFGNPPITSMGSDNFSIEVFIKPEGSSDFRVIIQKGNPGIGANRGYRLRIESNNTIILTVTGDSERTVRSPAITYNNYYHVVAIKDSTNLKIYLNGILYEGQNSPLGTTTVSNNLTIGRSDVNLWYFRGKIPISRLYNRALSASEVQQNFQALRGRYGV
jgi:hypothetical protein